VHQELLDRLVLQVRRDFQVLTEIQVHLELLEPQAPPDQQDPWVHRVLPDCPETLFQDKMELLDHPDLMETQERLDQ